jgi:hypothetical protein
MNDAAETAIRWYLTSRRVDQHEIDGFVTALREGYARGEMDSLDYRDAALEQALRLAEGTPHQKAIEDAVSLHIEIEELASARIKLTKIEQIGKLSQQPLTSPMAERIVSFKLRDLIGKL